MRLIENRKAGVVMRLENRCDGETVRKVYVFLKKTTHVLYTHIISVFKESVDYVFIRFVRVTYIALPVQLLSLSSHLHLHSGV